MKLFGLIGYPLTHSWSASYFEKKFLEMQISDHYYQLFPIPFVEELKQLIIHYPELEGLNVTIPYKISVLPFLDELSTEATAIQAVNCIKINRSLDRIILTGHNTDSAGFRVSILPFSRLHQKALILGTGGSSKAVAYVLKQLGIQTTHVSRNPGDAETLHYKDLDSKILDEHTLIVNTTPVGMFPNPLEFPPIPYHFLGTKHLLYDLVYNPEETLFLKKGKEAGTEIKNGLEMLQIQAEESWKIWNSI